MRLSRDANFFFFNDTATTEIYTLSLHDALPICSPRLPGRRDPKPRAASRGPGSRWRRRSEEHTSELQSLTNLVCRLLLEKKKQTAMFESRTPATEEQMNLRAPSTIINERIAVDV